MSFNHFLALKKILDAEIEENAIGKSSGGCLVEIPQVLRRRTNGIEKDTNKENIGTPLGEEQADSKDIDDPARPFRSGMQTTNNGIIGYAKIGGTSKGPDWMPLLVCETCNGGSKEIYYECPVCQDKV